MNSSPFSRSQERIVEVHLGYPRHGAEHDVLDAGLSGRGHRNRVAVAAEAGGDPQDVDLGE